MADTKAPAPAKGAEAPKASARTSAVPSDATPDVRWRIRAGQAVTAVQSAVRKMESFTRSRNYSWTEKQAQYVVSVMEAEVAKIRAVYKGASTSIKDEAVATGPVEIPTDDQITTA